jgi:hypothetical protein
MFLICGTRIYWFDLIAFGAENQGFLDENKSRHPASYCLVLSSSLANPLAKNPQPWTRRRSVDFCCDAAAAKRSVWVHF